MVFLTNRSFLAQNWCADHRQNIPSMSAIGTKRTWPFALHTSSFEPKAYRHRPQATDVIFAAGEGAETRLDQLSPVTTRPIGPGTNIVNGTFDVPKTIDDA